MKEKKQRLIDNIVIVIGLSFTMLIIFLIVSQINTKTSFSDTIEEKEFTYLSDIPYIKEQSSVGWGNITIDQTVENANMISLIVSGQRKYFLKGMGAHATSTLVYDISNYNYDYFSTYYGVDASRGTTSDGVKIHIYTSTDGINWDLENEVSPPVKKGDTEAGYIEVDIKNKKYIKLFCRQHGSATGDHCVYGGAKLYKEGYTEEVQKLDFIKTIEEYDEILKNLSLEDQINNKELVLLQRELVKHVGYDMLLNVAALDKTYEETLRWLMTDVDNLRLYINGGEPTGGNYVSSLKILTKLYTNFKEDFNITKKSKYDNVIGDVYKRMAITLSLTHTSTVALWMQPSEASNQSDPVTRYEIYKKLYSEEKFVVSDSIDITKWFESYTVEEMRFVMNNIIDDESIIWLNEYTQKQIDAHPKQVWRYLTPHPYMAYVWPNYGNPVFHDPDRKEYWDNLYDGIFSKYGVTYSSGNNKVYKVWMNFRNEFGTGAVCGGISKTGSNIRTVHGIPAAVIGQPGHAAIIYYTQNSEGKGYWGIDNDVSGWVYSEKGERMLLNWGNDRRYAKGYTVPYMAMAQEALNRFDEYQKSREILMLADLYQDDKVKREEYLWASLKELDFNVDTWYELIMLYNSDDTKTEEDYYNLASKLSQSLLEYPLPYYQLMALITPHMTSPEYKFNYSLLLTNTLTQGKNYNGTDVLQPSLTRLLANYLLGITDTTLASFSFNGEDAGKIVLSSRFDGSGIRWDYSLDGKKTWNEVAFTGNEEHKYQLTKDEIESITAENDIYVHIVGAAYNDENILKIDITDNEISESNYFRNDLENRILGIDLTYEWRNSENDSWTSYAVKSPDNTGDKTLQIRQAPNGTRLASNVLTFNFTEDNQPDTRKYIPVSHLSLHEVSTEAVSNGGSAIYALDANYLTRWHSAWNGSDTQRYITVKLDKPRVISAVEFVPAGGGNGKIYDGTIWGSMDGENWSVLTSRTNLTYTNQANTIDQAIANTKSFDIENPIQVQYIKIVADRTNGNWFTARAFNFFEDYTQNPYPTASIGFDKTEPTNTNVIARLINPSVPIKITNNGGSDTYTFTENGSFTFEFINEANGQTGEATATVTWIDKTAPTAEIRYDIKSLTNKDVTATLVPSEDITVLNNGNSDSDNPNSDPMTHMFLDNGEFTFEFKDAAGNIGTATAKVDWIDRTMPNVFINFSETEITNKDVIVTLEFDKPNVEVLNNGGKTTYTFVDNGEFTFAFRDEAGNERTKTVTVNWIDKVAPNAYIEYNPSSKTEGPVTAKIYSDEEIRVTNNGGSDTYTFTTNGSFEFTYEDHLGNKGKITAIVDWIKTEEQPNYPSTPDNPNKPSTPSSPNNPNNGNNSSNGSSNNPDNIGNNGNNDDNPGSNTQNPDVENPKPTYKDYSVNNIKASILENAINENLILISSKFITTDELKDRFGSNSEYIELYLENHNNEKVNIASKVKLTIKLDKEKEFLGIYEIRNGKVQELKYTKNNNEIELETNGLGKYVVHYKDDTSDVVIKENKNTLIWFILGSIIVLLFVIGVIVSKHKSKANAKEI